MPGHDPIVIQAIRNVLGRQSFEDWVRVPARNLVDAIYQEIRRLDRAALAEQTPAPPSQMQDTLTSEGEAALQTGD